MRFPLTKVNAGGVESWTNTVNVAVEVFPKESVAVIVTGPVKLSGKSVPLGIEYVYVTGPSMSVANDG